MDKKNGGMATYLTSEESPNLTESQFNEDIGYTSTQRCDLQSQFNEDIGYTSTQRCDLQSQFNDDIGYTSTHRCDLQSQFNEDIGYTSTQRELRQAAIHTCLKMNKKLNTNTRSGSIEDIFNAPTQEFVPPDDDNEVEIINEVKSIKKHSNVSTPDLAPPPPLQTRTISEVEINKSKYIEDVTTKPISGLTSLNKVEIIENQPGNRKDNLTPNNLTPRHGTELPQKVQNESIHLDVSDSSEYEHQQYVTSTTPPNSSSMHLSEIEHQTCSNTDVIKRSKSRTNRRHSDSTSELSQSSCSPLNSSQSTNLTSESSHSSPSECRSNSSNSLSSLLKRDSRSRSSSLPASPSLLECVSHSKSGSNHDSRSRSRSITSSRSKHGSRDRSRSKHSSHSRSRTKHGSRERSRSKHSSRSWSRAKHGSRERSRSKHSSRSRSRAKHSSRERSRSKHSSRSRSRAKHGSRDRSRSKHSSRSRSRTKHGSCSKSISTHSSHSRSKSKSEHRCRCRSRVNHGSRSKSRSKHVYDLDSCHDSSSRSFNQQAAAPSRHRNQSDSTATATSNFQSPLVVPHTDVSAFICHSDKDATYMKNFFKSAEKFQEKVLYYKKATLEIEVKEQKAIEDLNGSTRKLQKIQEELANLKQKSLKYHSMDSFCKNISNYVDVRGCLVNEMSPPPPPHVPTSESESMYVVTQSALSPPLSPLTPTLTSENLPIHSQPVTGSDKPKNMPTLLLPLNTHATVHRKIEPEPNVSYDETPIRMLPSVSTKKVTMKLVKLVEPVTLIKPQCQAANVAEGCISSKSSLSAKSSNPILPKPILDAIEKVVAANVGVQKKRKKPLLDTTVAKKRRAIYQLNKVLKEKTASQIDVITHDIILKGYQQLQTS